MSRYLAGYEVAKKERVGLVVVPDSFRDSYPALAEVFAGVLEEGQALPKVHSATLNLFWEGLELKFCIIPRFENRIAFGVVQEPLRAFESIDQAISAGRLGWKVARNGK
jgi:hypothetical protein